MYSRNFFIALLSLILGHAWANTTLAAPDIMVQNTTIPNFLNPDSGTNSDAATNNLVLQHLKAYSSQVRDSLAQSGDFQIVDIDNNLIHYYLVLESNPALESGSFEANLAYSKHGNISDYVLLGTISALSSGEEISPIPGSNKSSAIYSIDLVVDYTLVRTKDHRTQATFSAAGHAGQIRLATPSMLQKSNRDLPKLIDQVGNELAAEVVSQVNALNLRLKLSTESEPKEANPIMIESHAY